MNKIAQASKLQQEDLNVDSLNRESDVQLLTTTPPHNDKETFIVYVMIGVMIMNTL